MTLTEWFGIRRWHLSHVMTQSSVCGPEASDVLQSMGTHHYAAEQGNVVAQWKLAHMYPSTPRPRRLRRCLSLDLRASGTPRSLKGPVAEDRGDPDGPVELRASPEWSSPHTAVFACPTPDVRQGGEPVLGACRAMRSLSALENQESVKYVPLPTIGKPDPLAFGSPQ
jgi:hypothetical protein